MHTSIYLLVIRDSSGAVQQVLGTYPNHTSLEELQELLEEEQEHTTFEDPNHYVDLIDYHIQYYDMKFAPSVFGV